ncbi:MFS transporter [Clostridium saccharobutylicum]|uniref:MFS transporter n=1 Tax=Clostridium saccharobutylicum TaxID=169679 RepID=UPI0030FF1F36
MLSFFAVSAIALILFVIIELKVKEPMVPLSLFKSLPFTNGSITLFLLGLGMMSGTYLLSFFLIQVKGLNQLSAGLIISTMSLTSMIFSILSTILTKKLSSRLTSALGILLLSVSCYLNSSLTQNSSNTDIILRLIVAGSGTGLSMATLIGSIMANVPVEKIGIASGINNMTRTLGTVLGVALFLTIFTSNMTAQMSDVKAFSFTFKVSAVILLPGILFALFSDKKRSHDMKNKRFVENIDNV